MTSSSAAAVEFDVLLSFGEGDEGSGIFAEQLIEALHEGDVRVRSAGRDGGAGEANLIEASSVCIPIFCSSYAYSRRCLRELSEFAARKKIILPVFYGVDPSDVRRQRGAFEPAFGREDSGGVEEVGEIVGYVVADVARDGRALFLPSFVL